MSRTLTRMRGRLIVGVIIALTVVLACTSKPSAAAKTTTKTTGVSGVQIHLKVSNDRFVVGEDITMNVSVTNDAASDVSIPDPFDSDNWQPTYTLTGPLPSNTKTFSFRSVALDDPRQNPEGVEPKLITVRAGQTVASDVPLRDWGKIDHPGTYTIASTLDWNGVHGQSAPVSFTVQQATVPSVSVGVDANAEGSPGDWVEWFTNEGTGRRLYTALYQRPVIDVHGYSPFSIQPLFMAGPQATDLLSPWTNYNRMAGLVKWRVWREGATLFGFVTAQDAPHRLDLRATPQRLIHPALMTRQGELHVVALMNSNTIALARFPKASFRGPSDPATVAWTTATPGPVATAHATIGPEAAGSPERLVVITREQNSVGVHLMNIATAGAAKWQTVHVPGVTAMEGSEPGIAVREDGTTQVAVVVETSAANHEFGIIDLSFDKNGAPVGAPKPTPLGKLQASPRAAVASYAVVAGTHRRDWMVLLSDTTVVHSANGAAIRRLKSAPALPLQLVGLSSGTYVLCVDANGKPEFLLLD